MAYNFTVNEKRDSRGLKAVGQKDRIAFSYELRHDVHIEATGGDRVEDVDDFAVFAASGLPVINQSVYYSSSTGLMMPFLVCREKEVKPHPKRRSLWTCVSRFKSIDGNPAQSDNEPIEPPDALTDISPTVQTFFRETERALYEDYSSTPKPITLPSGEYFSREVVERVPLLGLKITQYEASSVDYDDFMDRKLRFNDAAYRGKGAYSWIVEEVEPSEVTVQLSGGATNAWLVSYTLLHNPLTNGWRTDLALLDYKILVGGKFVPNREGDPETAVLVKVDDTGAKKGDQSEAPDYETFIQQQTAKFSGMGGFLQV